MRKGYIYIITNKVNNKQYVGQTSRDIWTRFDEHCYDDRSTSAIHAAIKKYGVDNFDLKLLEEVDLNQLDTRERYWINEYNTCREGYNKTLSGIDKSFKDYKSVMIVENGFIIDSLERLAREIAKLTDWSMKWLKSRLQKTIKDSEKDFLGYHFKIVDRCLPQEEVDPVDLENWIKTLNIRYQGQHIYCEQLDKQFNTVGEAAKYFVDNNMYKGTSKMPIQTIITSIGYNINGKSDKVDCLGGLTFYRAPGTTKQTDGKNPFCCKKIYCPELDKEFPSVVEAAKYFIDNKIWGGIKLKTAKLRISDVVRGVFPDYRKYTFQVVSQDDKT